MDLLTLKGVEVGYHRRGILPPLDLRIARGTSLGIVGSNGSGKTTLLRTILGLLPPVGGKLEYPLGRPPRFGYVPQRTDADPSFPLTALDLITMVTGRRGKARAIELLGKMGLGGLERRSFHALSGGQRQRALIARALATSPEVLVLDEPTNGLDVASQRALLDVIATLGRELDLAIVLVSHQASLIESAAKDVLTLERPEAAS